MPHRPNWEYIRVDVQLPDHPKLDGLSYAAKWTFIELLCWCGEQRTDGFVRQAKWKTFGTTGVRDALVAAGLAEPVDGGWQVHDYLDHQRSREEIAELSAKRSAAARRSVEARAKAKANAEALAEHGAQQNGSKPPAEAEAEADRSGVHAVDQRTDRNAGETDEIDLIIAEIKQVTGQTITSEWAVRTRDQILLGRRVSDRASYLRQAIRAEASPRARFLPASLPPRVSEVAPANGHAARGDTVTSYADQARAAIARTEPP